MACNFSFEHYLSTVSQFRENGVSLASDERSSSNGAGQLKLVHDVDFDLELALDFARLESSEKVSAHYFVRLHSRNYNLFSLRARQILSQMRDLGHNVGLHFEGEQIHRAAEPSPTSSDLNTRPLEAKEFLIQSLALINNFLGFEMKGVNLHEPARTGLTNSLIPDRLDYSYQSLRFENYKYLSDSGGRWREGCFCLFLDKIPKIHSNLLVNTHPIWWFEQQPNERY